MLRRSRPGGHLPVSHVLAVGIAVRLPYLQLPAALPPRLPSQSFSLAPCSTGGFCYGNASLCDDLHKFLRLMLRDTAEYKFLGFLRGNSLQSLRASLRAQLGWRHAAWRSWWPFHGMPPLGMRTGYCWVDCGIRPTCFHRAAPVGNILLNHSCIRYGPLDWICLTLLFLCCGCRQLHLCCTWSLYHLPESTKGCLFTSSNAFLK